jgi:hypothetical protein
LRAQTFALLAAALLAFTGVAPTQASPPPERPPCPEPLPCPEAPPCPELSPTETLSDPESVAPALYWRKAMQWMGSDRTSEGRLLLRDISREYPTDPHGIEAAAWLEEHKDRVTDGRAEFIIGSTMMGAYFGYSATLGASDDIGEDETWKTAMWMSLGGGLLGLGGSALASQWMSISESQALLYNFAGGRGFMNGFLVYDLIWTFEGNDALIAGATGMGAGIVTSLALWPHLDVDDGVAQMSVSLGGYTLELALLGAFVAGGENVFRDSETAAILGLLVPANAAVVAGYFLGNELKWSGDDVRYVALGGFLGNLLGASLLVTIEPGGVREASGIMAASVVGGLAAGLFIVRPWETPGDEAASKLPLSAGLLHVAPDGLRLGAPIPRLVPVEKDGRVGVGFTLQLLTSSL